MATLRLGDQGDEVRALQTSLQTNGFSPGTIDGDFGHGTEAAVLAFQQSHGLLPDGVAGPLTQKALGLLPQETETGIIAGVTTAVVSKMFPHTPVGNIKTHLPPVCSALVERDLTDKPMVLMALATIRAETESFEPVAEGKSRYNTSPNGHPFDLYDNRRDLGNTGAPDGEKFRGRGFIQLTGRANYTRYGKMLDIDLVTKPELASDAKIAGQLLALFIKDKEVRIKQALLKDDLAEARRLVNGGSHGLDRFTDAYRIGSTLL